MVAWWKKGGTEQGRVRPSCYQAGIAIWTDVYDRQRTMGKPSSKFPDGEWSTATTWSNKSTIPSLSVVGIKNNGSIHTGDAYSRTTLHYTKSTQMRSSCHKVASYKRASIHDRATVPNQMSANYREPLVPFNSDCCSVMEPHNSRCGLLVKREEGHGGPQPLVLPVTISDVRVCNPSFHS